VVLALGSLLAGCNKETPVAAEVPGSAAKTPTSTVVAQASPATPAAGEPAGAAAGPRVTEESFELGISAKGPFEVGKAGSAEIVLEAKGAYKVNDKYPYKFKLKETSGLNYPALVVGKDRVKLEQKRATLPVAFTPDKPGKHTLAGQFAFSVCTDDKCLIERRDLALDIEVK